MDIYDQEVERLTKLCEGKDEGETQTILMDAWSFDAPDFRKHSPLFDGCTKMRCCGPCITQLKSLLLTYNPYVDMVHEDIKGIVRESNIIPEQPENLVVSQLAEFAKIQRFIDTKLGRPVPELKIAV